MNLDSVDDLNSLCVTDSRQTVMLYHNHVPVLESPRICADVLTAVHNGQQLQHDSEQASCGNGHKLNLLRRSTCFREAHHTQSLCQTEPSLLSAHLGSAGWVPCDYVCWVHG